MRWPVPLPCREASDYATMKLPMVLTTKVEARKHADITADFSAPLLNDLPVADMNLAALVGNALDNAFQGVQHAEVRKSPPSTRDFS